MKLSELQAILQAGGNATLDRNGYAVDFTSGYQVSKRDFYILEVRNANKILRAINGLLKSIAQDEFVGLWINERGELCIDVSERIPRLYDAIRLGIERGQDCIFDWCTRLTFGTNPNA